MAFFGKKKTNENNSLKELPDFPSFLSDIKFPEFPEKKSESEVMETRNNQDNSKGRFLDNEKPLSYESLLDKPINSGAATLRPINISPKPADSSRESGMALKDQIFNINSNQRSADNSKQNNSPVFHEEKPLFIRINDYEEAVYTLEKIRAKLREADRILEELDKIRSEEERQLQNWKRDLIDVKEKLLLIDKQLFESK